MNIEEEISCRCRQANIPLPVHAAAQIARYHQMLLAWNEWMDLTAVSEPEEMIDRLYVDSLTPLQIPGLIPVHAKVIDVGSGAGFPGLPLSIARPDLCITLLDAQQKRVRFLQAVIEELGLSNVKAIHGRAEDAARLPEYREAFDLALARAVASLPVLLEFLLPFVKENGLSLCWKGPSAKEELPQAKRAAFLLGGELSAPVLTTIPGRDWAHVLIPCQKTEKTLRQYPRRSGIPGQKPLGGS